MRNLVNGILVGLLILPAVGCGETGGSCTAQYAYGLTVLVKDYATNQPICDATVRAIDVGYDQQLEVIAAGTSECAYVGAGERVGNYTVSAMKSGYLGAMRGGNVVTAGDCHVQGVTFTLHLQH